MNQLVKRYPVLTFFILTTALGWIAVTVGITAMPIDEGHEMTAMHGILVFLIANPSVVGVVLTTVVDGRTGLKEMFSRVACWRVSPVWYAIALLLPFSISGLGYLVQGPLGGPLAPINFVEQLVFFLPFGLMAPLFEEFGWRGFARGRRDRPGRYVRCQTVNGSKLLGKMAILGCCSETTKEVCLYAVFSSTELVQRKEKIR